MNAGSKDWPRKAMGTSRDGARNMPSTVLQVRAEELESSGVQSSEIKGVRDSGARKQQVHFSQP